MLQIIKIEWLKVKNYRTFWVFIVLSLLSVLAPNFIIHDILITCIIIFVSHLKQDKNNLYQYKD